MAVVEANLKVSPVVLRRNWVSMRRYQSPTETLQRPIDIQFIFLASLDGLDLFDEIIPRVKVHVLLHRCELPQIGLLLVI